MSEALGLAFPLARTWALALALAWALMLLLELDRE
jgi:hypothetical protein